MEMQKLAVIVLTSAKFILLHWSWELLTDLEVLSLYYSIEVMQWYVPRLSLIQCMQNGMWAEWWPGNGTI